MRFKINFNSALVLSLCWHLLCFFTVVIVIAPIGMNQNRLSEVYFLGSLPDRNYATHEIKSLEGFSKRKRGVLIAGTSQDKGMEGARPALLGKENNIVIKKRHYDFKKAPSIYTRKIIPDTQRGVFYKEPSVEISGPGHLPVPGEIVSRPLSSEFKEALTGVQRKDNLSSDYDIEMSVLVRGDGTVGSTRIIKSSGAADVDNIMQDYIKGCRFNAMGSGQSRETAIFIKISF
jgi:hypothetical protein